MFAVLVSRSRTMMYLILTVILGCTILNSNLLTYCLYATKTLARRFNYNTQWLDTIEHNVENFSVNSKAPLEKSGQHAVVQISAADHNSNVVKNKATGISCIYSMPIQSDHSHTESAVV